MAVLLSACVRSETESSQTSQRFTKMLRSGPLSPTACLRSAKRIPEDRDYRQTPLPLLILS